MDANLSQKGPDSSNYFTQAFHWVEEDSPAVETWLMQAADGTAKRLIAYDLAVYLASRDPSKAARAGPKPC